MNADLCMHIACIRLCVLFHIQWVSCRLACARHVGMNVRFICDHSIYAQSPQSRRCVDLPFGFAVSLCVCVIVCLRVCAIDS